MPSLNDLLANIHAWMLATLGVNKDDIKAAVIGSGGDSAWNVIVYMADPKVILLGLIPCILLERFIPSRPYSSFKTGSLLLDYLYPIFHLLFTTALAGYGTLAVAYFYKTYFPGLNTGLLDDKPFLLQVLGAFLIVDLMLYWAHRLRHEVLWLWHFHAIHHSQRHLNAATTNRTHFAEKIISRFIITLPIAFVGGSYPAWFAFVLLNNFWGYFIHSNTKINLGFLGKFIVSPQFHRVHHSIVPDHFDKNYGERLVVWDWLFGTYHGDRKAYPPTGINDAAWIDERSNNPVGIARAYFAQQVYPAVKIAHSVKTHGKALYLRYRPVKPPMS